MKKDVIYIDVEDDITAIVGKIKGSGERIVALVPPKRVGVLQSAVNMRLLARAAKNASKRVVLITNDHALSGLAAAAEIPVAKTLQSKPEIAEVPALKVDDGDDIIDGSQLLVGELAEKTVEKSSKDKAVDELIKQDDKSESEIEKPKKPKKSAVPDFNIFRKKLLIFGGLGALLITFLAWAIWFAPHATVIITAKTTTVTVDKNVALTVGGATDAEQNVLKALKQEQQKELSVEFAATGKKNVGDRATGAIRLSNTSSSSVTISAGTILKNNDLSYTLSSSVTVPAATLSWSCPNRICPGTATGSITAVEGGAKYNAASGAMTISVSEITARLTDSTSGGTDRTASVVTADDIKNATAKLDELKDAELATKIESSFGSSAIVIKESYQEQRSEATPSVAVDQEATGNVQLKTTLTASMLAIDSGELTKFLEANVNQEIGEKKYQKVYDNGADKANFAQFANRSGALTVRLSANATVGPEISEETVKEQAKGKSYGDVQSSLESIDGVKDVDTKFSYFWVRTVPNDDSKISVEFKLENGK